MNVRDGRDEREDVDWLREMERKGKQLPLSGNDR